MRNQPYHDPRLLRFGRVALMISGDVVLYESKSGKKKYHVVCDFGGGVFLGEEEHAVAGDEEDKLAWNVLLDTGEQVNALQYLFTTEDKAPEVLETFKKMGHFVLKCSATQHQTGEYRELAIKALREAEEAGTLDEMPDIDD